MKSLALGYYSSHMHLCGHLIVVHTLSTNNLIKDDLHKCALRKCKLQTIGRNRGGLALSVGGPLFLDKREGGAPISDQGDFYQVRQVRTWSTKVLLLFLPVSEFSDSATMSVYSKQSSPFPAMLTLTLLNRPLFSHAETDFIDHTPIQPCQNNLFWPRLFLTTL
jgi:hypothetical protein